MTLFYLYEIPMRDPCRACGTIAAGASMGGEGGEGGEFSMAAFSIVIRMEGCFWNLAG